MTFFVETRFEKPFKIDDSGDTFELQANYRIYWVFVFANKDIEKIEGTKVGDNGVSFSIPDQFFTLERRGELSHRALIIDSDANPILWTDSIQDKLVSGGPELSKLNL